MKEYDGCLPPIFRMLVAGSSSSGKSTLVRKILLNENGLLTRQFERVVYLRGVPTQGEEILRSKFGEAFTVFDCIPSHRVLLPLCQTGQHTVLVVEDLDDQACSSALISQIFTRYSHHYGFSVILSTQNIFRPGKERLTLTRNATHIILFQNNLDHSVVRSLAYKVHPKDPQSVVELFDKVLEEPYAYLSFWSDCSPELKFRSHVTGSFQRIYNLNHV
jgi:GTPase SAR1 family protein